jgi:hypothetical protein
MSSPFGEARGQLREEGSARRRSQAGRVGTSHPSAGSTSISGRLVSRAVLPAVECRTTGNVTGELSRRETVGARSWPGRCASTRWSSRCGWCSTHGTSSTANETWQRQVEKKIRLEHEFVGISIFIVNYFKILFSKFHGHIQYVLAPSTSSVRPDVKREKRVQMHEKCSL